MALGPVIMAGLGRGRRRAVFLALQIPGRDQLETLVPSIFKNNPFSDTEYHDSIFENQLAEQQYTASCLQARMSSRVG